MEPQVLTIPEAAAALRIGRSAAYDAARRGEIPTVRIGRTLRVPRHKLAEMLGEESNGTGAASGPVENQLPQRGDTDEQQQHRRSPRR